MNDLGPEIKEHPLAGEGLQLDDRDFLSQGVVEATKFGVPDRKS